MASVPQILGVPLWRGRIKRRVAKKWLRRFRNSWMLKSPLRKLRVGDAVNDCSGQNGKVLTVRGYYSHKVLVDVDIQTESTGCSLRSCGISPAWPPGEVQRAYVEFLRTWTLGESGKHWYGPQWDFYAKQAERIVAASDAGEILVDDSGKILPQFVLKRHNEG
jgi:hypothetical protein